MDRFFGFRDFETIAPFPRGYALIDDVEPLPNERYPWRVVLDVVDADWFDAMMREFGDANLPLELFEPMPAAIVTIDVEERGDWPWLYLDRPIWPPRRDDAPWLELTIGSGGPATYYRGLFDPAGVRTRVTLRDVDDRLLLGRLKRTFSPSSLVAPSDAVFTQRLGAVGTIDRALVFDVGQGSAVALVASGDHEPSFYFDLGGGVTQHARTFPRGFTSLCATAGAFVVMSHWDWDHWSSGNRFAGAKSMDWFFPDQGTVGPVHGKFAAQLAANGKFHLLSGGSSPYRYANFAIESCTGKSRNDSGLALTVDDPGLVEPVASPWLFPADAEYAHVPATLHGTKRFGALTVPHHGAAPAGMHVPAAHGGIQRAVVSVGKPNHYKHPSANALNNHTARGWNIVDTRSRSTPASPQHYELTFATRSSTVTPCGVAHCPWLDAH